ncbi:LpqB family beta-propeller domain-containing protein [Nocardioides sp. YIM 152315]|uniref:LpqB family beta-propeller domain-containing protein n=1 Tax=Nocardioides sp. YIM 152315 TaxID=3031760 RepID=UPI0023DB249D|nr:LpqB family beta-propeller domain-containing protein [Nocardioides sp. YIM 152315]MDF1606342.1 LpqB family beta-propeller domain-containing protein [Nocardioides sp. YIM 152315]
MRSRRTLVAVATLAAAVMLGGCVGIPTDGPVVETQSGGGDAGDPGVYIDPRPPQTGDTRAGIVQGFLAAMQATPIQTNTAREFLTEDAAASWTPDDETITYAGTPRVTESGVGVSVSLSDPVRLDAQGAWQGPLPRGRHTFEVPMAFEDGEWRIDRAPNALIVPESWFARRYRQVSLYYFDPTASILAPEPVYVPTGKQLASTLTQALLLGPGEGLDRVVRSFIPPGLTNFSVPISDEGVADIALKGDAGDLTPQSIELMMAQLAWTLRQETAIEALRVSIDGEAVPLPGGVSAYRVDGGSEYDPSGWQASPLLYGLRDGRLASGTDGTLEPVSGPMGADALGVRSVGVSLTASRAAGVSDDGSSVVVAPVSGTEEGEVRTVVTGATDLLKPAWDASDRMWLVDRTAAGAVVSYVDGQRHHELDVPGVSGRQVRGFVVSRDGTRLIAVVRTPAGDVLRLSRVARDRSGRVLWATPARRISGDPDRDLPIRAIAWRRPTLLGILSPFASTSLAQLHAASVDGSPAPDGSSTTREGPVRSLAGSPAADDPLLGVSRRALTNLSADGRQTLPVAEGTTGITYVG